MSVVRGIGIGPSAPCAMYHVQLFFHKIKLNQGKGSPNDMRASLVHIF